MDSLDEKDDVLDTYDDEVIKRNDKKRAKGARAMGLSHKKVSESISLEDIVREELYNALNEKGPKCWDGYKKDDKIK